MAPCPVLQVQINQIDHCLAPPGPLDNSDLPAVPVIRIYGSSSTGKKCCVHVHQVYPYFFVEYSGKMRLRSVNRYINKLTHSLNYAIALSLKKDINSFKPQFVRAMILVKGIHFYGFHSSYSPFLKVYIVDPAFFKRAVTIMRSGTVMGTHFRIFESHLSFTLQFMSDFGLYGCGVLDLSDVFQRGSDEDDNTPEDLVPKSQPVFQPSPYFCQTRMPLEVDVAAFHILNRHQVTARNLHHKLTIPAPLLPPEPFVLSVRELWEDERNRRRACGLNPSPDMPVDPSESSRTPRGDWVAEAMWWENIRSRIENERGIIPIPEPENDWEKWVMTAFESVEALWEDSRRTWKPAMSGDDPEVDRESAADEEELHDYDIDVDNLLSDEHLSQLVEREAEWEKSLDHDIPAEDDDEDEDHLLEEGSPLADSTSNHEYVIRTHHTVISSTRIHIRLNSREDLVDSPTGSPPHKKRRITFADSSTQLTRVVSYQAMRVITHLHKTVNLNRYVYAQPPPSTSQLLETMDTSGIPRKIYRSAFYSSDNDVPKHPREYGGFLLKPDGQSLRYLDDWEEHDGRQPFTVVSVSYSSGWEYSDTPPSVRQIKIYLASEEGRASPKKFTPVARSQVRSVGIEGPTQANIYGLKTTPGGAVSAANHREKQAMTVLSLEVFAPSAKTPTPELDEIVGAFYSFQVSDSTALCSGMVIGDATSIRTPSAQGSKIDVVSSELDLLNQIVDIVVELDPDILVGWEIQAASWGYLNERGQQYGLDIADLVSRAPTNRPSGKDHWGMRHTSTFKVVGRHVLNLWRIIRVEQTLNIYTFENVAFHILRRRSTPRYSPATLHQWYRDSIPLHTDNVLRYFSSRTTMVLEILDETEVVTKTAEFARVFGVDFFSVISRGSQFKVESFMFRIAKPESFVLISPSQNDVGRMNAAEAMPLIMEPLSCFYTSPVVVLDFQSLYPSIMIANNYCYSTFLGRVKDFQGKQKFGVTDLSLRSGLVETLYDHINVSPTGMMFVKPEVRKGLLGRMLAELLDTRVMVKQAMKGVKDDKALRKILDARQLGLKYIANVTYGYTSATMSGRMPAVEIADRRVSTYYLYSYIQCLSSIVQSGRETLEKAITIINATEKWGAQVRYERRRSYLPGKTKDQAFRIGHEIADNITSRNPVPIKLKFEKACLLCLFLVYLPCVLLAKKRYVGFKYENPDDVDPVFDAKGIETVRRDGVLAQRKMTETCLKILFRTQNLSEIKDYCYSSWQKLIESKASIQDFIFAKEVRMGTYSEKGPPPPGVALAARQAITENTEPQHGERVPYVICRGSPNSRLVDRVAAPLDVLKNSHLHLDADYYISRVLIPPLDRILSLAGCDVQQWYRDMPKAKIFDIQTVSPSKFQLEELEESHNIDEHFFNFQCYSCGAASDEVGICDNCYLNPESAMSRILSKIRMGESRLLDINRICASCTQSAPAEPQKCDSLDCAYLYARTKAEKKLHSLEGLSNLLSPDNDIG
ncbi:hypothetical protein C8R43DRAFT_869366 [Mycena crocata]|nr:hypothetical protein C8R43DRAFT_869366 [Mycena crocata]